MVETGVAVAAGRVMVVSAVGVPETVISFALFRVTEMPLTVSVG